MRNLFADVRFALRLLRRSPGFAATLLTVLILGIGATTAIFSVVESLLLSPLPFDHPGELTVLWTAQPNLDHSSTSYPDFTDWRAQGGTFESMAGLDDQPFTLTAPGIKPELYVGATVTGDFFSVFRVKPLAGRLLDGNDDTIGGPRVAIISARVWQNRFDRDPALVGKTIMLDGEGYTVVGVAPQGFNFGDPDSAQLDIWTPMSVTSRYFLEGSKERGNHFMRVVGRRKPGISVATAQTELSDIAARLSTQYPKSNIGTRVVVHDLHEELLDGTRSSVVVLFAAIGLVFLVVCANVANLLLTRGAARRSEMTIRAALGATRSRLALQLVTETVVIFLLGAIGSVAFGYWLVDELVDLLALDRIAGVMPIHMDGTALVACFGLSLLCGLVFGLVPALVVSRVEPQAALQQSATRAATSRSHHYVRGGLVITQVALAVSLLVGSGLALHAFLNVSATSPGFDTENRTFARFDLPKVRYPDDASVRSFVDRITTAISAQPGVRSVAFDSTLPYSGWNTSGSFKIEGQPAWAPGEDPSTQRSTVSVGFFGTLGMPLLRGRDFTSADVSTARHVVIVSKSFADRFFPGGDAIGQRIDLSDGPEGTSDFLEIVGVVGDVRRRGLSRAPILEAYEPLLQHSGDRSFALVVHTERPSELLAQLPDLAQRVDSDEALSKRMMFGDLVARTLRLQRSLTVLLAVFAGAALLLATIGIFGLVSYSTAQRTRELGIRMALGSTPNAAVALVLRGGLALLCVGLAVGLVGALGIGRLLATRLTGVTAFDLPVYGTAPLALVLAGIVACLAPAIRAVRIAPAAALRNE